MQKLLQHVYSGTKKTKNLLSNWVLKISCLKQNGGTLCLTMFTDSLKKLILGKSLESSDVKLQYDADIKPVLLFFMEAQNSIL